MKHKFLSILLAGTVLSGSGFYATAKAVDLENNARPKQEHQFNREEMHKKMALKMNEELNLTEAQQKEAKAIREKGQKDIAPLMDEMKALREKIDAKRRANMEEFEKILTPEQKEKFEAMKANAPKPDFKNFSGKFDHHGPKGPRADRKVETK